MPVPRRRAEGGGDLRFGNQEVPVDDDWLRVGWLFCYTNNVSISRKNFDAVDGFNETFGLRWGLEDMEFSYRVHRQLGFDQVNFAYDDLAAVYHLPHHRDQKRNGADYMGNLATISRLYPIVDWEFFGPMDLSRSADRVLHYRSAMRDCVRRSACRIAPAAKVLAPDLPGPRVLWIGTGSAEADLPAEALTFDYAAPTGEHNHHLVGMHPPIGAGSLDAVVSVDFWRYLHWPDLCQFVNTASSLAGEVHLVATGEELSAPLRPDPATLDYFRRVMDLAFHVTLSHVDGLGPVLRLMPRQAPAAPAA
jgi:hypothetical protein